MKRRNLTPQQNSVNINFTEDFGVRTMVLRAPSVVDEFYHETCQASDDCIPSVSVVDPIIMLFNQERIEAMGQMAAKQFIDSLTPKSSSLEELRKQCSDDDLMQMIKSKHLQSPAEILSWCRYMNENVETFNSEVQKLVDAKQAEEAVMSQQVLNIESSNSE